MSPNDTNALLDESSRVFLNRLQKSIFVLGLELGFLLQGSTVPVQHLALTYVPHDTSIQLFLSLIWGYILASTGLLLFLTVLKLVKTLLHLEEGDDAKHHNNDHSHHLVDLQCQFAQGSVVGVLVSWLLVDGLLNFRTRVLYGGIMFLVSLLFVIYGCLERTDAHPQEDTHLLEEKEGGEEHHHGHALVHVL